MPFRQTRKQKKNKQTNKQKENVPVVTHAVAQIPVLDVVESLKCQNLKEKRWATSQRE